MNREKVKNRIFQISLLIACALGLLYSGGSIEKVFALVSPPAIGTATQNSDMSVTINWTTNGASSYNIYRLDGATHTKIGSSTSGSYTDNTVLSNKDYYYQVTSVSGSEESALSSSASVRVVDRQAPTFSSTITGTPVYGGDRVNLSWSPATDNVGVKYYEVSAKKISTGVVTSLGFTKDTEFFALNLDPSTAQYTFSVKAYDSVGLVSAVQTSATVSMKASVSGSAPGTPGTPSANRNDGEYVEISWPSQNGNGTDATTVYYEVLRDGTTIGTSIKNSFVDATGVPGSSYSYTIKAWSPFGNGSAASSALSVMVPDSSNDTIKPDPPTNLSAQVISALGAPNVEVKLSWKAPSTEANKPLTYKIWKSQDQYNYIQVDPVGVLSDSSYTIQGLLPDTEYYFMVTAYDAAGNGSAPSSVQSVQTPSADTTPPTVPSNAEISWKSDYQIDLIWDPSTDASGIRSYEIERKGPGESSFTKIATVNAPFTYYSDKEVLASNSSQQQYSYQIRAIDNVDIPSDYTTVLSDITLTDTTDPVISLTSPLANEKTFGKQQDIKVVFSDPMDPTSVQNGFSLKNGSNTITGTFTWKPGSFDREFTFNPGVDLTSGVSYTLNFSGTMANKVGLSLTSDQTISFTVGQSNFTKPHGYYTDNTYMCKNCHNAHTGKREKLLNQIEVYQVCYTCHDGTGSTGAGAENKITAQFGEVSSPKASVHPVYSNGKELTTTRINCASCHNPHDGGKNPGPNGTQIEIKKLLQSKSNATSPVLQNSGPELCWNCHGKVSLNSFSYLTNNYRTDHETYFPLDRASNGTYSNTTYRDSTYTNLVIRKSNSGHGNIENVDGNSANPPKMSPPSGTKISCVMCHEKHGSDIKPLLKNNIQDPDMSPTDTTLAGRGSGYQINSKYFCYQCHKDAVKTTYTMGQASKGAYDGETVNERGGHNQFDCTVCHNPHGSPYPKYLRMQYRTDVNSSMGSFNANYYALCFDCHDSAAMMNNSNGPYLRNDSSDSRGNYHSMHVAGGGGKDVYAGCKVCHRPHGAIETDMKTGYETKVNHRVGFSSNRPTNYNGGIKYLRDIDATKKGSCELTCHNKDHKGLSDGNMYYGSPNRNTKAPFYLLKENWRERSVLLNSRPSHYRFGTGNTQSGTWTSNHTTPASPAGYQ